MALGRRSFEEFIAEAIKRCRKPNEKDDSGVAERLGTTVTSLSRWRSAAPSGTGIKTENLKALVELAGYDIGDCLYFPDEISHMRAVDVALFGKEKKPG